MSKCSKEIQSFWMKINMKMHLRWRKLAPHISHVFLKLSNPSIYIVKSWTNKSPEIVDFMDNIIKHSSRCILGRLRRWRWCAVIMNRCILHITFMNLFTILVFYKTKGMNHFNTNWTCSPINLLKWFII